MQRFNRLVFWGYVIFSLVVLVVGYFSTPQKEVGSPQFKKLYFNDVLQIFTQNTIYILSMLLLALFVLSPVLIVKFLLSVGGGAKLEGAHPIVYYVSSATHGFGEWLMCFFVFLFTAQHLRYIVMFFQQKVTLQHLKHFYLEACKRLVPVLLLILIVSAWAEVYVSNRLYEQLYVHQ